MKSKIRITSVFFIVALVLMISCEKDKDSDKNLSYQEYNDLTVSDAYEVVNGETYVVIDNANSLNAILKTKDHVDNPQVISESDFKDNIAIAIVKQYNNVCGVNMNIDTVLFSNDKIQIFYDNEVNFGDAADGITCSMFARPTLVILTNKKEYSSIDFYENDNLIESINK